MTSFSTIMEQMTNMSQQKQKKAAATCERVQ